jgi:hypothetical protein
MTAARGRHSRHENQQEQREAVMRDVVLYMSMSLDGFVGSDREHPGMAIPEGADLKQCPPPRTQVPTPHLEAAL